VTAEILTVFIVIVVAVVLFVTEKLRVDIVALLMLVTLAVSGLVAPKEALSGFSNPAVITVIFVFILSSGLAQSGIAGMLGRQVLRIASGSEIGLIALIMLTSGVLSAFMNNVAVAALLLPVVVDIARRTRRAPSKLLMPLAFASLLGGLTTLIGTPPNILISEAMRENGLAPFQLFDFTPVGVAVLAAGIVFMVLLGRHLLPERDVQKDARSADEDLRAVYRLKDELGLIQIPSESPFAGKTLAESRFGSILGLNVVGILRAGGRVLAPGSQTMIEGGDRLLVEGRVGDLGTRSGKEYFDVKAETLDPSQLISDTIAVAKVEILEGCIFIGETLRSMNFRHSYGPIVLAIRRHDRVFRTQLENISLEAGDELLVQGSRSDIDTLRFEPNVAVTDPSSEDMRGLEERLMTVGLPEDSPLVGKTLVDSRLGDAFGIGVMGIVRQGETHLIPDPGEVLRAGDKLLIKGRKEALNALDGLGGLEIEASHETFDLGTLESERVGLAEAVLSPRSRLVGKTLVELHFREKYGLNVVAISRGGVIYRTSLRDMPLRLGDALLLHGPRDSLRVLASEPDFIVLTEEVEEPLRLRKAPVAIGVMGAVVLSVVAGLLPIYIAVVAGAILMVVTGCVTMDEAYRTIEWKAVFLIAGMLPLGIAMEQTGAATFLTEQVVAAVGDLGPMAIVAALFLVTALCAQFMPTAAVAILMAPIALNTARDVGISHEALMMAVAMSASASFMSPVAHPANVLIMGPGGYRFSDYIRVGLPLTIVCLVAVLLVLPFFWPLTP
jgi:di/tricarboxylate transporter